MPDALSAEHHGCSSAAFVEDYLMKIENKKDEVVVLECASCGGKFPEEDFFRRKDGTLSDGCKSCTPVAEAA